MKFQTYYICGLLLVNDVVENGSRRRFDVEVTETKKVKVIHPTICFEVNQWKIT